MSQPGTWIQYPPASLPHGAISADCHLEVIASPSPDAGWRWRLETADIEFSSRLFCGDLMLDRFGAAPCFIHLNEFVQDLSSLSVEAISTAFQSHLDSVESSL